MAKRARRRKDLSDIGGSRPRADDVEAGRSLVASSRQPSLEDATSSSATHGPGENSDNRKHTDALERFVAAIGRLRTAIGKTVFPLTLGVFGVVVGIDACDRTVLIAPIGAPKAFIENGFTPQTLGQRLMDEVLAIRSRATSSRAEAKKHPGISPDEVHLDIQIPGLGLSYASVSALIRRVFQLPPDPHISGEITAVGDDLRLRLRITGDNTSVVDSTVTAPGGVDALLRRGAEAIEKALDPYVLGVSLRDEGRIDDAVAVFEHCTVAPPDLDDSRCYNSWGNTLRRRGDLDGAIEKYERAIELDAEYARAYNNLGRALDSRGDEDDAIDKYRRAIAIDPNYAEPHVGWGILHSSNGEFDQAIEKYERAIEIDPTGKEAYYQWGRTLLEKSEWSDAIRKFTAAIERDGRYAAAFDGMGIALARSGDYTRAIHRCRTAVKLDPENADMLANLGHALFATGACDEARARYHAALERGAKDSAAIRERVAQIDAGTSECRRNPTTH